MTSPQLIDRVLLKAIDGANPMGFLAALGTLRLASLRWPDSNVSLGWQRAGYWQPALSGIPLTDPELLCDALLEAPAVPVEQFSTLGKNITVPPDVFRRFAAYTREAVNPSDRRLVDFASAFACEDCSDPKTDRLRYTQFCFITGSGHQDFLGTMAALKQLVEPRHIFEALFSGWQGNDKGNAFRWDPADAREYALRWNDPGKEGAWTTWGANRLALEALPFFPVHPHGNQLATTGFKSRRAGKGEPRRDEFTWPIWTASLGCDEVRSLLALADLQADEPPLEDIKARGVAQVFRASRIRIGQGANFKVSFRPSRPVA